MSRLWSGLLLAVLVMGLGSGANAQSASASGSELNADSVMVFESPRPLIETDGEDGESRRNTIGVSGSFSDYGFGGGVFLSREFGDAFSGVISTDFGPAKGRNEFGLDGEAKVNRIFVVPVMLSAQYRPFEESLGDNFRPYVTGGAGPVFVTATPADQEFFSAFRNGETNTVLGGFVGAGANFGVDKSSSFGANVRYYIIPYPKGVESTRGVVLTDVGGLYLTVTYGYNF